MVAALVFRGGFSKPWLPTTQPACWAHTLIGLEEPLGEIREEEEMMGHHKTAWYLMTRNELIDELADKRDRIEELKAQLEGMVPKDHHERILEEWRDCLDRREIMEKKLAKANTLIIELQGEVASMVPRAEYEEEVRAKEAHRDGMAVLDKRLTEARAEMTGMVSKGYLAEQLQYGADVIACRDAEIARLKELMRYCDLQYCQLRKCLVALAEASGE